MNTTRSQWEALAQSMGARMAERFFQGRRGHGNAPASEMHVKRDQLAYMLAGAVEIGMTHGAKNVPALIAALEAQIGPAKDLTNLTCHLGLCAPAECGRCMRELNARAVIAKALGAS